MIVHRTDARDWKLFASTVLLISSTSRIALEEIDELIATRARKGRRIDDLVAARRGVAGLALIHEYYNKGEG